MLSNDAQPQANDELLALIDLLHFPLKLPVPIDELNRILLLALVKVAVNEGVLDRVGYGSDLREEILLLLRLVLVLREGHDHLVMLFRPHLL